MHAIDWTKLKTFDDWAGTLNTLLDESRSASAAKDAARIETVANELVEFQEESPNVICRTLDQIADRAVRDLLAASVTDAVSSIASRSSELAQYVKEMKAIVTDTKRAAESIRFERAKDLVLASTNVIQTALNLRSELKSGADDKKLDQAITAAIEAVQELRNRVESTPHI